MGVGVGNMPDIGRNCYIYFSKMVACVILWSWPARSVPYYTCLLYCLAKCSCCMFSFKDLCRIL